MPNEKAARKGLNATSGTQFANSAIGQIQPLSKSAYYRR